MIFKVSINVCNQSFNLFPGKEFETITKKTSFHSILKRYLKIFYDQSRVDGLMALVVYKRFEDFTPDALKRVVSKSEKFVQRENNNRNKFRFWAIRFKNSSSSKILISKGWPYLKVLKRPLGQR